MRYFLDTEFNGSGGELISLGLVPEHGDQEFYRTLPLPALPHPWVERNVIPYLHMVPTPDFEAGSPEEAGQALAAYLQDDEAAVIIADWPEDIAHFCRLLVTGPGQMVDLGSLAFELLRTPGFSTAANSKVPHNALHDARALRGFVLAGDGPPGHHTEGGPRPPGSEGS